MSRYNIDQLAEPIIIVLEGKEYTISKITADKLEKVSKIEAKGIDAPIEQLALLLDEDKEKLVNIDIRKLGLALKYIQENILKDIDSPKNS